LDSTIALSRRSESFAIHSLPSDYPSGKAGDVLMVEFTVAGIPCIGLNGGPAFKHNEAFSFQIATDDQHETDRYWNAIVGKWRAGKRVRLVQRQVGRFLANHAARADSLSVFNWCRLFSSSANNNENAGGQGLRDRSRSCLKGGWAMLEKLPPNNGRASTTIAHMSCPLQSAGRTPN